MQETVKVTVIFEEADGKKLEIVYPKCKPLVRKTGLSWRNVREEEGHYGWGGRAESGYGDRGGAEAGPRGIPGQPTSFMVHAEPKYRDLQGMDQILSAVLDRLDVHIQFSAMPEPEDGYRVAWHKVTPGTDETTTE